MKIIPLSLVLFVVAGIAVALFIYYSPGTGMYRPLERRADGIVAPMPMLGRYTEYLDKMEAVLKREGIRHKRTGPYQLYFDAMPAPERLRDLEVLAGIPSP